LRSSGEIFQRGQEIKRDLLCGYQLSKYSPNFCGSICDDKITGANQESISVGWHQPARGAEMIIQAVLACAVAFTAVICGAPIVIRCAPQARWLTKICLSFALGFALLMLAGVFSVLLRADPLVAPCGVALLSISSLILDRKRIIGIVDCKISNCAGWQERLDKCDWLALAVAALYIIICIAYFDRIIIWMGGDSLAHAEIVRMLMDKRSVPISIPPLASYWEYYPKGFHIFVYPWAMAFGLLDALRTIPILITAAVPLLLYSILREKQRSPSEALYAMILACFVFPAHYSYLIWGGFPTATAEMLSVATILSIIAMRRWMFIVLPILLLGVLFAHARLLSLAVAVLILWQMADFLSFDRFFKTRPNKKLGPVVSAIAAMLILIAILVAVELILHGNSPKFLLSVLSSRDLATEYAARWYPGFLSLFGMVIAFLRRDKMDRLALSWLGALAAIVLLADTGPLGFIGTADRLLLSLYLPLSILAASALSMMEGGADKEGTDRIKKDGGIRIKAAFALILTFCGILSMFAVFYGFAGSWGLPEEDYKAIKWLEKQNYSDAVCINLDETGAWVYPLNGIRVTRSRMSAASAPFNIGLIPMIIADPANRDVINALGSIKQARYLIFISSVSISRPGYIPPFAENLYPYPSVNLSYPTDSYDLIYQNATRILGFPKEAFMESPA
jgi:hypothetical protein